MGESRGLITDPRAERMIVQHGSAVFDTGRFEHMWRIAQAMAVAKLMPDHLRAEAGNCLMVVEQADRWGMSPFAVAQKTYAVSGKLGYEGQLIHAVVLARAPIEGRLDFTFEGDEAKPATLAVTVSGTFRGEGQPKTVRVAWTDGEKMSKGAKDKWVSQPAQQLSYFAVRQWARRWCPDVIMGVYTPDELAAGLGQEMKDITPASEQIPPRPRRHAAPEAAPLFEVANEFGDVLDYRSPEDAARAIMDAMSGAVKLGTLDEVLEANNETLGLLPASWRERIDDHADELRDAAPDTPANRSDITPAQTGGNADSDEPRSDTAPDAPDTSPYEVPNPDPAGEKALLRFRSPDRAAEAAAKALATREDFARIWDQGGIRALAVRLRREGHEAQADAIEAAYQQRAQPGLV